MLTPDRIICANMKRKTKFKTGILKEEKQLKKEWGSDYEKNLRIARAGANSVGTVGDTFTAKLIDLLGYKYATLVYFLLGQCLLEPVLSPASNDIFRECPGCNLGFFVNRSDGRTLKKKYCDRRCARRGLRLKKYYSYKAKETG